jgi:arylsulfatase A-like enzyme
MIRVTSLLLILSSSVALWADDNPPPNLVFVLSDDHRHDFLGCAGHPVVRTPVIDSLARDGVRFSHAFVTTSICAASRATILTGLVERTHGFTFGTPPIHRNWVAKSYPALLRQRGYRTGFVGKFGVNLDGKPEQSMFEWFRPLNRQPYVKVVDGKAKHVTDMIGDEAIGFVESTSADQPFCLSISFNAAHAEDHDKADHYPPPTTEKPLYRDVTVDQPRLVDTFDDMPEFMKRSMNRDRWYWRWDTRAKYERNVRDYYRLLTAADRNVGRVLESLQRTGRAENTVVIFMGDNGYYKGDRGFAGKWSHFEESLRVPLVIFDPRQVGHEKDRVCDAIALNLDIAPTLLDLAGVEIPNEYQGMSMVKLTENHQAPWARDAFACEHLMDHPSIPKWEGIRTRRFTYAKYFQQDPPFEFLHDRQSDPDQRRNVVDDAEYAEDLAQLRERSGQMMAEYERSRIAPSPPASDVP